MITREKLQERLAMLKQDQALIQQNLIQLQANLNAYNGAIEECELWLAEFDKSEPDQEVGAA